MNRHEAYQSSRRAWRNVLGNTVYCLGSGVSIRVLDLMILTDSLRLEMWHDSIILNHSANIFIDLLNSYRNSYRKP